jgi:hypothetical protein
MSLGHSFLQIGLEALAVGLRHMDDLTTHTDAVVLVHCLDVFECHDI